MKMQTSRGILADATITRRGVRRIVWSLFLIAAAVAAVGALASSRANQGLVEVGNALPANIIVVTNTNDSGPGSLREALADANDGDTIDATGVSGTILLTGGELQINHNVTINGPGAGSLAVNGNATSRVFHNFASNVTISGFTITNGFPPGLSTGGGIFNGGGLTLSDSVVSNSVAPFAGGGIFSTVSTTLTVMNSTISGNSANGPGLFSAGHGGGIDISSFGMVTVINSTITNNSATCRGGGIAFAGNMLTVTNGTISGNLSEGGGNCAGVGGGIYGGGGTLSVTNSTISGNSATGQGGGIYNSGELELGSTILNRGSSGENILNNGGSVTSLGYNLASDNGGGFLTGPGDQINTDPMLGPLQDNGGPTFTHALLPGSPAIDTGDPNFTPPPFFDQRGPDFWRVRDGRIDIGSFEVQSGTTPSPTPTPTASPTPTPTSAPTATPTATATPRPTPTARPLPTSRPRPTPAPRPTT